MMLLPQNIALFIFQIKIVFGNGTYLVPEKASITILVEQLN